MRIYITHILAIILLGFIPSTSYAEEISGQNNITKHVNVTIEIHGLDESAELLRNASGTLAERMEELKNKKGNLSTEDLERLERIATSMAAVAEKMDKTLQSVGPAIRQVKEPTVELISSIIKDTKIEAIDPVIASVQLKVSESVNEIKWSLITVGAVFLIAIIVLGLFLYRIFKQINGIASTIRETFERGEFIFRPRDENKA